MEDFFSNLLLIAFLLLGGLAQWIAQAREARARRRRGDQPPPVVHDSGAEVEEAPTFPGFPGLELPWERHEAHEGEHDPFARPGETPLGRTVEMPRPAPVVVSPYADPPAPARPTVADRHLVPNHLGLDERHLPEHASEVARRQLRGGVARQAAAATPRRMSKRATMPRSASELRRVFVQTEILAPPLALRKDRARRS